MEWPRPDLKHLTDQKCPVYTEHLPQHLNCHPFCFTTSHFRDARLLKIENARNDLRLTLNTILSKVHWILTHGAQTFFVYFTLRPTVFEIQCYQRLEMHWMTCLTLNTSQSSKVPYQAQFSLHFTLWYFWDIKNCSFDFPYNGGHEIWKYVLKIWRLKILKIQNSSFCEDHWEENSAEVWNNWKAIEGWIVFWMFHFYRIPC